MVPWAAVIGLTFPAAACTGELSAGPYRPPDGVQPTNPSGGDTGGLDWAIDVDTSGTTGFVPEGATTVEISGVVNATLGGARIAVDGASADLNGAGAFTAMANLDGALTTVAIEAADGSDHQRKAHRSFLRGPFLPSGALNPAAVRIALDDGMLATFAEPLADLVADIDVASEIRSRPSLIDIPLCTARPTAASHDPARLALITINGGLGVEITIPAMHMELAGECNAFIAAISFVGSIDTDVVIRSALAAPPQEGCVSSFTHEYPEVEMRNLDVNLRGTSGDLLLDLVTLLTGEIAGGAAADAMKAEFAAEADRILAEQLESLPPFAIRESVDLFGTALNLELCLTGLARGGDGPVAVLGAIVARPEPPTGAYAAAPGAPFAPAELPSGQDGMLLDANLIGQMLFASWQGGGLRAEGIAEVPLSLIGLFTRGLTERFGNDAMVQIGIDAKLPPRVTALDDRAGDRGDGDLLVELGELELILSVAGEEIFRLGTELSLNLALVPVDGGLRPEVVTSSADVWLLDEPMVEVRDEALEDAVATQIGAAAAGLFDGVVVALPGLGDAARPASVEPLPGGRYLQVRFE